MTRSEALQLLGLKAQATPEELKKAYHRAAAKTHPDVGGSQKDFERVNAAYKFLQKHGTAGGPHVGGSPMADFTEAMAEFREMLRRANVANSKYRKKMSDEEVAAMKESDLQGKILAALEAVGAWTFNVHGHVWQKRGIPDIYIAHPHWTGWLEIKLEKRPLESLQCIRINDLLKRHVPAMVLRLRSTEGDWGPPGLVAQIEDSIQIFHLGVLPVTSDVLAAFLRDKAALGKLMINFLRRSTLVAANILKHRVGDFYPGQPSQKVDVYA